MASILTRSGFYFPFEGPHLYPFEIEEIAAALSNICRFTGHCRDFYSVAQHSVIVSQICPSREALLHDASEAYLGDVSRPLKSLLPEYRALEETVEKAIQKEFHLLHGTDAESVRRADLIALATERRDLLPQNAEQWPCLAGIAPLSERIIPLPPKQARDLFLARFRELTATNPKHATISVFDREDEMIVLHQGGKYLTTLYASCPEQAADFVAAYGHAQWTTLDDCTGLLKSYREHWKSKDTEDEGLEPDLGSTHTSDGEETGSPP